MAKTVNRLALQQSLVRNGLAEDPAAGNVADDWGDEIDAVTADLATKEDLDKAVERIEHRLTEEISALRLDMETRDRERAERESEWWRLQQERDDERQREQQEREDKWRADQQKRDDDWRREQQEREDKWRAEQQKRDDAREKREDDWRREMQARDDARQKRDDDWRREQQKRDDAREKRDEEWRKEQRERDREASKATSRILWAIFGAAGVIGTIVGIVVAVT